MAQRKIGKASDVDIVKEYKAFVESFRRVTVANVNETSIEKAKRIKRLEASPEEWFRYYFPNYCTSEPAPFHKEATKRIIANAEWFEVRAWSRELAKSARSMMEVIYLAMTGKIKLVILASANLDSATKLIMPFKACFESNQRLINDYGEQQTFGQWDTKAFKIKRDCAFYIFGAGQSPRGVRNENIRPDFILIDDIDTDEEVRNEDIQKHKYKWIMEALYATRSISKPLRVLVNGNIIGEHSTVKMLEENADHFEIVNIRDSITINTTIAAVSDWFENLDTNFVRWNVRHKEFKYLTGGKAVGDKVFFAQCVEGVWYKVKAVITEKQMDDNLFDLTVKSTTGLGVITFRAEKQPDGSVLFTHIESFGARRSFFGNFVNWLFFKALFPKQANWELIKQDMQEDDRNLKKILERNQ